MRIALGLLFVPFAVSLASANPPTQIERRIAAARETIASGKATSDNYNELANALVRRARETGDAAYCEKADGAAADSLRVAPGSFEGRKARVAVRLCQARWTDALDEATLLHKQVPDDVPVWGYVADAQIALGNYDAAEKAAQWMIDLRRMNPQCLQRGAELRERFGFNDPALEWWNSALHLTSTADAEERAWILTRMARVDRILGRYDAAEGAAKQALALEADYPWALEELARGAMARKNFTVAVELLEKRQSVTPSVAAQYELGVAMLSAGRTEEARHIFTEFEKKALALLEQSRNANLELIRYYSGPGNQPAEALRIAKATRHSRHDEDALAVYAVALAAQGDWKAAAEQMAMALQPGVKDPDWLLTAGKIAQKSGDAAAARKYFQQALEAAPQSPLAGEAIQALSARQM
jgi:tetratricopeptide (TPR) repeat protein